MNLPVTYVPIFVQSYPYIRSDIRMRVIISQLTTYCIRTNTGFLQGRHKMCQVPRTPSFTESTAPLNLGMEWLKFPLYLFSIQTSTQSHSVPEARL